MKKLAQSQKERILIELLVSGCHKELADQAVERICKVIESAETHEPKKPGRKPYSAADFEETIARIVKAQKVNKNLTSVRSIAKYLSAKRFPRATRPHIKIALEIMKRRSTVRLFKTFRWKFPRVKSPLSD